MNLNQAAHTLQGYFPALDVRAKLGSPDGKIGVPDLRGLPQDEYAPSPLREAVDYVLNSPYAFLRLDTNEGQKTPDGLIEYQDLQRLAEKEPMSTEQVTQVLEHDFAPLDTAARLGPPDGLVGAADLNAAIFNPYAPPAVREASLRVLSDPALFQELDLGAGIGPADGLISLADVQAVRARHAACAPCFC